MKKLFLFIILFNGVLLTGCKKKSGDILVFSKTEGFRHESIAAGIDMFNKLGAENDVNIVATEDATYFKEENLKNFKVVVFLNTTGDCLNDEQQYEFKRFIQAGGGFLGVHSAADTEYDWPWYNGLVGAYFNGHPNNPNVLDASIDLIDKTHISCQHLPERWDRTDEWYNYKQIHEGIIPVLNLDESSYEGGTNGDNHPIAWYHEYDGGRAYYTGGGHTNESYAEEHFVKHIWGAVEYCMGDGKPVDFTLSNVAPAENRFHKMVYDEFLNEPMELDLLPDGRIVFVERRGAVKLYDPEKDETLTLTTLDVFSELEDGLLGLAIDPNYAINKHIFLYHSPPGDEAYNQLSRFDFYPDNIESPLQNRVDVLRVDTQRESCCHSGGSVEFGPDGNIFLSTGDNTNPFESDGHSPSDFRNGRSPFDAQKSSANPNDLRGKILRIKPESDGSYSIPSDNLFADGKKGRPEIYVMGCRNPYRISIDKRNKNLYWGEVGPDANEDNEKYGPRGYDEVNQAKKAGFFGWPLFIGDNKPYRTRNFASDVTGEYYDPERPVNNSPNNTGVAELPSAQKAMIYYPYAKSEEFPQLGTGGRNAMAGPVFYADDYPESDARYPEYYDGKFFAYEWMRGWIMAVSFDEKGDYKSMEPFLPSMEWANLIDIVLGPDGDMFTLEYGKGWFTKNTDARLSRLMYNKGNRIPVADYKIEKSAGAAPFTVAFDGTSATDPDGDDLVYSWDFGDGNAGSGQVSEHTYNEAGIFEATLTTTDKAGMESKSTQKIFVGNEPPEVAWSLTGGNETFYFPGSEIEYEVNVSDAEDGILSEGINPENVVVTVDFLEEGHDKVEIAMGHKALSEVNSGHPGLALINESDCLSCHKEYDKSIGPSYEDIAKKYSGDNTAVNYLADKIVNGGGGVWGENVMAAHPDLTEQNARLMSRYIMSIKETSVPINGLPTSGKYSFDKDPNKFPNGRYIMSASYVDMGAEGAERLICEDVKVLRPPTIMANEANELDKAQPFKLTSEMVPDLEEEIEIIIMSGGAKLLYKDIDLTGLQSIEFIYSCMSPYMAGGEIELFVDDKSAGKAELVTVSEMGAQQKVSIPLGSINGKHDIIIRSNGGMIRPTGALMALNFIPLADLSI